MRSRALRLSAALPAILCVVAITAQAEPVAITQVVQVVSNFDNVPNLQIRSLQQSDGTFSSIGPQSGDQKAAGSKGGKTTDSLISGVTIKTDGPTTVEVIDQGDVEGTICDCGELFVAAGGFPKWPLFFLGAIPLFFIDNDCENCDSVTTPTPTPTPPSTPTPPPTPVPEPASLMLLGAGLAAAGAAIRRQRQANAAEKEEN